MELGGVRGRIAYLLSHRAKTQKCQKCTAERALAIPMHHMHQKRLVHDRRVRDEPAHLEFRGCRAPVSPPSMSAWTRPRPRCRFSGGGPAARAWRLVPTACADAGAAAAATVFCVKGLHSLGERSPRKRALLPPRRGARSRASGAAAVRRCRRHGPASRDVPQAARTPQRGRTGSPD